MKHLLLTFLLVASSFLAAQHVIKFRPQSLLLKNIALGYEYFIKPTFSLQLNASYAPYQKLANPYFRLSLGEFRDSYQTDIIHGNAFSLTPEVRFYHLNIETKQPGFYVAPYLRYYHAFFQASGGGEILDYDYLSYEKSYRYIGKGERYAIRPGVQVGQMVDINKHFKLDLFWGLNVGTQKIRMETLFYDIKNMTEEEALAYSPNISPAFYGGKAKTISPYRMLLSKDKTTVGLRCGVDICYKF